MPDDLRTSFGEIAPGMELHFHAFVPSGILAREILNGVEADVYVSANTRFMNDVWKAGLAPEPRVVAGNRLCIVVRAGYSGDVNSLVDLSQSDVRLVTPQFETDPCGQYVVAMFERAGLTRVMAEKEQCGRLMHSVGSGDLPDYLLDVRADAGIFYLSEAIALGDAVRLIVFSPDLDMREDIVLTIAAVERGNQRHPGAKKFIEFMTGESGQRLLKRYGFSPATGLGAAEVPGRTDSNSL